LSPFATLQDRVRRSQARPRPGHQCRSELAEQPHILSCGRRGFALLPARRDDRRGRPEWNRLYQPPSDARAL